MGLCCRTKSLNTRAASLTGNDFSQRRFDRFHWLPPPSFALLSRSRPNPPSYQPPSLATLPPGRECQSQVSYADFILSVLHAWLASCAGRLAHLVPHPNPHFHNLTRRLPLWREQWIESQNSSKLIGLSTFYVLCIISIDLLERRLISFG